MKVINVYISGFKMSLRNLKMAFLIYCINLVLALLVVFPFLSVLKEGLGGTMLTDSLVKGFDLTSFSDFMRSFNGLSNFIIQARWMILFYLILNVFISGGILFTYKSEGFSVKTFLNGCVHFSFRFFKLSFYMLVFNLLVALIVYLPVGLIVGVASDSAESESALFYIILFGVIIHLILFAILQMVAYYTKIRLVSEDSRKVFRTIFRSIKFAFIHFAKAFSLFILQLIVPLALVLFMFYANRAIGMTSGFTIFFMFIIQQIFLFTRVFTRNWMFASQYEFYNSY